MRTETISYAIQKRKRFKVEELNLIGEIQRIENMDIADMTEEIQSKLAVQRDNLESLRKIKIEGIVTRSRTRWYEEGEKSTAYFLGLEKRNYLNKLIASLRDANNEKKTKQTEIIDVLVEYFTHLFAEQPIDRTKAEEFLDGISMKCLSEAQQEEMNRPFTLQELSSALKGMANNKAPGTDGFPAEFYKAFWKDLKHFLFKMASESYDVGGLPNSLKEGIITLIPKPLKPRDEVKSYRPITLLNASYKILSAAVANRIKNFLPEIVSKEQTGFIKNRFIGDNTRLTYDLIHSLKEANKSALFLSLDIQDAFNSVNWEFIRIMLRKLHFPDFCIRWFDTLCFEAASVIVYNGHISKRIPLERSCRQGDPLSPYIFVIVMGALLERIKENPKIAGVKLGNLEFKLSAYADDTLCYLDGSVNSCRALFDDLGIFAKYSGLKPNIKKTQAFWAGKDADSKEPICLDLDMKWTKKLKVLGITFSNEDAYSVEENYESKLTRIKNIIASWRQRHISLIGKIIIIKTLLLPILTHVLTALPEPPNEFMKRLKASLFQFLWNGKVDRIKRSSLYKPVLEGGMNMVDIDTYNRALKASWIRREITGNHDWCQLFRQEIAKSQFIWERNALSLKQMSIKTSNKFWAQVMMAMAQYDESICAEENYIGRHSIWFSNYTKFKTYEIKSWKESGMVYINDLLNESGEILSFEEAKKTFRFKGTMLDYLGLLQSLPREWKSRQRKTREMNPLIHPNVQNIISHKQGNKHIYNVLLRNKYENISNTWELSWEREIGRVEWEKVYAANKIIISVQYQALQYKILTKIIATNRLLYQIGRAESYRCDRCREGIDTIVHRFWSCTMVKRFWTDVACFLQEVDLIQSTQTLNKKAVILGFIDSPMINHIIMVGKKMIANKGTLFLEVLLSILKKDRAMEKDISIKKGKMNDHDNKWANLTTALA